VIFLFLSFTVPIVLGLMAWGTPKWTTMGPWNLGRAVFSLFAVLSVLAMILIFILGIQPPNDWALYITVGFFVLTAIVWFGFERRRFRGPPLGDMIASRQVQIREAERAVGEIR
jgi:amino acid transporter